MILLTLSALPSKEMGLGHRSATLGFAAQVAMALRRPNDDDLWGDTRWGRRATPLWYAKRPATRNKIRDQQGTAEFLYHFDDRSPFPIEQNTGVWRPEKETGNMQLPFYLELCFLSTTYQQYEWVVPAPCNPLQNSATEGGRKISEKFLC